MDGKNIKKWLPDARSMLGKLKDDSGDNLNYLYLLYRISSFDTHGRSFGIVFEAAFGKECNFLVLKIKKAFEYMAKKYVDILNDLRDRGRIQI